MYGCLSLLHDSLDFIQITSDDSFMQLGIAIVVLEKWVLCYLLLEEFPDLLLKVRLTP